jgi:hypothetical protein
MLIRLKTGKRLMKKEWFVRNGVSLANLVILLGILVAQAQWQQRVDDKLENFEEHRISDDEHMPLKQKFQLFVPRTEFKALERKIDLIDTKVDILLNKEINGS